ncbi:hypothetical protein VTN77DRAFT_2007 [Rasamsonia byssochlamydoides]|uniref:uncharacterized protein n=1 Tax=Rasamsonia byssochlamydoides TaxID=89139 RepID=UPI00374405D8
MASKGIKLPPHGHTAGIYADMSVDGPPIGTLVAVIDRAKNLPNRKTLGKQNPYCAARLGKEAKKTETDLRGGQTPKWDQELRFTVHDSPDYYQLKVSVFNDDKKTDLIGETWIDLKNLIVPGGGQSDKWHGLQFKGKYAGEVRIEMTYYDTRPEDETVVEKRKEAAEKIQAKNSGTATAGSSLSGPRKPKQAKRRPLPEDPTASSPARPEHPPQSHPPQPQHPSQPQHPPEPQHHPQPQAPGHAHSTPPEPVGSDYARPSSKHGRPPDVHVPQMHGSSPATHPPRGYDMPDDLPRERASLQNRQPSGNHVSYPQEVHVPYPQEVRMGSRDQHIESYDPPYLEARPVHAEYDDEIHQGEPHWQRQPMAQDPYDYPPETDDVYRRHPYETPHRQSPHQAASPEHDQYNADHVSYGQHHRKSPHAQANGYESSAPGLPQVSPASASAEQGARRQYNTSSIKPDGSRSTRPRRSLGREGERPTYASMQPTVEDEQEEGSAPPPPPPVHRSTYSPGHQRAGHPPPPSSYKAYSQEYAHPLPESQEHAVPAPMSAAELDLSHSGNSMSSKMTNGAQKMPYPPSPTTNSSAIPPSLVAGYDAAGAGAEPPRAMHESRSGRMQINMPSPTAQRPYYYDAPQPQMPAPSMHASPAAVEERALVRRSRSRSPDPRGVPHRKSISPKPSPVEGRDLSSVPFGPDSYNAFNPNARRSSSGTGDPRSRYEAPDRETDSGRQSETQTQGEIGPIIGDDGRIIDPSDHLPSDTWAPEPERKTKKPEVIVRFKHPPQNALQSARSSAREMGTSQTMPTAPDSAGRTGRNRLQKHNGRPQSYGQVSNPSSQSPPHPNSGPHEYDKQNGYGHQRNYSTPPAYGTSQALRRSASPSPSRYPTSSLYALENTGPPIPTKVPIAPPVKQNYPATGMDALSQEMQSIDIGSVGWDSGRRRYAPRTTAVASGYAR